MTRHGIARLLAVACALSAVGCGRSPRAQFYTLVSTATPDGAAATDYAVAVGPVSVPASVERPQFVVEVAPNRVAVDEFNRWAAPLDETVARVVAGNLAVLLATPRVASTPLVNFDPAYRVSIAVQRFESILGEAAVVEAVWAVRKSDGGATRSGRTLAREGVQGKDFDGLAAAHSRALLTVSTDIAAAVRAEAADHGKRRGPR